MLLNGLDARTFGYISVFELSAQPIRSILRERFVGQASRAPDGRTVGRTQE
jgi:hypothetical protein